MQGFITWSFLCLSVFGQELKRSFLVLAVNIPMTTETPEASNEAK